MAARPKCTGFAYAICGCSKHDKAKAKKRRVRARTVVPPLDICGQLYDVIAKRKIEGDLEGQCIYDDNLIELLEAAEGRMLDTLLHEAVHAIMDASGGKFLIRTKHRLTPRKYNALEEDFIRALVPGFLAMLVRAGWLRMPRLSAGTKRAKAA